MMQSIDRVLSEKSKTEFITNAPEIKKYVRDALLSREFGPESDIVYRSRFADDVQFQTALKLIADRATYDRLLKPKVKSSFGVGPLLEWGILA